MNYKLQKLSTENLQEIIMHLPVESKSRSLLFLALRDGPQPVGRVIDEQSGNFLMKLPKELMSPGYGFYCFFCKGELCEFLLLDSAEPDITLEKPLPNNVSEAYFTADLTAAIEVHRKYLTAMRNEIVANGMPFVPVIRG